MIRVSEMKKGKIATIKDIQADFELKNRFLSFGIAEGEEIKVKEYSLGKQTIKVEIDGTNIAIRREEADKIKVTPLWRPFKISCQSP